MKSKIHRVKKQRGRERDTWCLQDFHRECVHPPYVGVEDEIVRILPVRPMLLNGFGHDYAVQYAVHVWIV